jgi:SAM-dependent methyltransferase
MYKIPDLGAEHVPRLALPVESNESRHDVTYWNSIAGHYDQLYSGRWSAREDRALQTVVSGLRFQWNDPPTFVDLGCGTGLGFDLLAGVTSPGARLIGVDASSEMIDICRVKHPGSTLHVAAIEDAHRVLPTGIDIALMLSSVGSYVGDLGVVLADLRGRLNQDGRVLVSVLNRRSLRRLVRGRVGAVERYHTRGDRSRGSAPEVRAYSRSEIATLVHEAGYRVISSHPGSPFAGVLEWPPLWLAGTAVARVAPWSGHGTDLVITPR